MTHTPHTAVDRDYLPDGLLTSAASNLPQAGAADFSFTPAADLTAEPASAASLDNSGTDAARVFLECQSRATTRPYGWPNR